MKGVRVGYIRVSTLEQNTDRQLENILPSLEKVYTDKVSGKDTNRSQLQQMLDYVREGDVVYVHSMDRLARNLDDLRKIVQTLVNKGVRIEFVKENLVFTGEDSPLSILTLSIMGAFAEFERSIMRERQREGIAIGRKKGAYDQHGRPPKLTKAQIEDIRMRAARGESKAEIGKDYRIARQTVYEYLKPDHLTRPLPVSKRLASQT